MGWVEAGHVDGDFVAGAEGLPLLVASEQRAFALTGSESVELRLFRVGIVDRQLPELQR